MILDDPSAVSNPFFLLAPSWATLPLVAARHGGHGHRVAGGHLRRLLGVAPGRAARGCCPGSRCGTPPGEEGGQIYVPVINWILFVGVLVLTAAFRSSSRLAAAYGLAVTGTLLLTSALFLLLARHVWRVQTWKLVVYVVLVVGVELTFLGANLTKIVSRRVAAPRHRGRGRRAHDDVAAGRGRAARRGPGPRGPAPALPQGASQPPRPHPTSARCRRLPTPQRHDDAARAAHQRRLQPRGPRPSHPRADRQRERAAHPPRRPRRGRRPRRRHRRVRARQGARRLHRQPGHPQGTGPGRRQDRPSSTSTSTRPTTSCRC